MAREPILIVDDSETNLKLVRIVLESEQYEVRTALNATEALIVLRTFRPRMILMDLQLPGMDGLELTRQLKADPAFTGVLVYALTAYAMKGDREKALAAGCDGYITKPADVDQLIATIAAALGR